MGMVEFTMSFSCQTQLHLSRIGGDDKESLEENNEGKRAKDSFKYAHRLSCGSFDILGVENYRINDWNL